MVNKFFSYKATNTLMSVAGLPSVEMMNMRDYLVQQGADESLISKISNRKYSPAQRKQFINQLAPTHRGAAESLAALTTRQMGRVANSRNVMKGAALIGAGAYGATKVSDYLDNKQPEEPVEEVTEQFSFGGTSVSSSKPFVTDKLVPLAGLLGVGALVHRGNLVKQQEQSIRGGSSQSIREVSADNESTVVDGLISGESYRVNNPLTIASTYKKREVDPNDPIASQASDDIVFIGDASPTEYQYMPGYSNQQIRESGRALGLNDTAVENMVKRANGNLNDSVPQGLIFDDEFPNVDVSNIIGGRGASGDFTGVKNDASEYIEVSPDDSEFTGQLGEGLIDFMRFLQDSQIF